MDLGELRHAAVARGLRAPRRPNGAGRRKVAPCHWSRSTTSSWCTPSRATGKKPALFEATKGVPSPTTTCRCCSTRCLRRGRRPSSASRDRLRRAGGEKKAKAKKRREVLKGSSKSKALRHLLLLLLLLLLRAKRVRRRRLNHEPRASQMKSSSIRARGARDDNEKSSEGVRVISNFCRGSLFFCLYKRASAASFAAQFATTQQLGAGCQARQTHARLSWPRVARPEVNPDWKSKTFRCTSETPQPISHPTATATPQDPPAQRPAPCR